MINTDYGDQIIHEIMRAIAIEFNWPNYVPTPKQNVKVSTSILNKYIGSYVSESGLVCKINMNWNNIELTCDDCIRLCSPTISTTKLNGGIVQHQHLWRHAPESLIRMIINQ